MIEKRGDEFSIVANLSISAMIAEDLLAVTRNVGKKKVLDEVLKAVMECHDYVDELGTFTDKYFFVGDIVNELYRIVGFKGCR